MSNLFNIDNYKPLISTEASAILAFYQRIKSDIECKPLRSVWTVWLDNENELSEYSPIVLAFENCSLEVCCLKDDELAVSTNTIDITRGFNLYDLVEMPCHWRQNAVPDLQPAIGKRLLNVDLLEFRAEGITSWMLHGMIFVLDDFSFCIYNAFDSNGIETNIPVSNEYRRINVW